MIKMKKYKILETNILNNITSSNILKIVFKKNLFIKLHITFQKKS